MSMNDLKEMELSQVMSFLQSGHVADYLTPFLVNLLIAGVIYVVGSWVIRKLMSVMSGIMRKKNTDAALSGFVFTVLSVVLKFILLIVILEQMGVNTTSLLALLGAAGLAVGLAVKDSLSNFASGVMLIILKPFKAGDYVEVAGVGGSVERVSIFSTILLSVDNKELIIPNAQIYQGTITNYSVRGTRRNDMSFAITYGSDLEKAKDIIFELIRSDDRAFTTPEPVIAVTDLSANGVSLSIRVWVNGADYWAFRWQLLERIKLRFDKQGIEISPLRHEVKMQA